MTVQLGSLEEKIRAGEEVKTRPPVSKPPPDKKIEHPTPPPPPSQKTAQEASRLVAVGDDHRNQVEPLILGFKGSEQYSLLLVYLLLVGISSISIAARKKWVGMILGIAGGFLLMPLVAYVRLQGEPAHPGILYGYCLLAVSFILAISARRSWGNLYRLGMAGVFFLPFLLMLFSSDPAYQEAYRAWLLVLPLVYSLTIIGGHYLIAKRGKTLLSPLYVNIGAVVLPILLFFRACRQLTLPIHTCRDMQ